jgi:glycine/D-amino acid oxidase-like deaminating enzyme
MRERTTDVVIVGGGGVGSAAAYFLSLLGEGVRVIVCERDPTYARASTSLAAGGIRQQFSTPENVLMSRFGYEFLEHAEEALAVGDISPNLALTAHPYLRLAGPEQASAVMDQVEMQRGLGATPQLMRPEALAARFPWMRTDDLAVGVLGGSHEGVFDPYALLQAFRRKSIAQGALFLPTEVVGVEVGAGGRVEAVRCADGGGIRCGLVINAAGSWAAQVASLAGLELPVVPLKAQTFAFRAARPVDGCPIVLDHVQQLNFKPEGVLYLAACPRESKMRGIDDFDIDAELFERFVWPALSHRVPQFDTLRQERGWVGHIEWNTFDANPIIGPHPDCPNFYFANGFSGHGVQHLPATGRAIAELALFGEYRSLDLSRFRYERIALNEPLRELV